MEGGRHSLHPCPWRAVLILPPALPPAPMDPFQAAVPTVHWQQDAKHPLGGMACPGHPGLHAAPLEIKSQIPTLLPSLVQQ